MGFKLRQPIKIDPVARYEVPFTPDNIPDNSGLVARANDNGNMIVNKNIPKDSKLRKIAESHEDNHLRQMIDGKLAYDDKAVYHDMDGKGMKKTPRSEFDESDKTTPWEAPAYKAGEDMAKIDMRPKKNKLNRADKVEAGNFSFAFREMNKPIRKQDQENVSMSENFGTAMVKKFGKGFNLETRGGGQPEVKGDTDPSGNNTAEGVKMGDWGPWQLDPNNPKREVRYRQGENSSNSKPEYRVKAAISGGKAGAGYDETMTNLLESGATYEELAAEGHGTIEGLRARFEGKFTPSSSDTVKVNEEQERFKEDTPEDTPEDIPEDTPGIEITTTDLTDEDKKRFKLFKDKDPSCKLKKTSKGKAEVTCTNSGRSGIFGLKTKGEGVSSKSGEKVSKTEKKNRNQKVFAPVKAIKDAASLGKDGRKNKRKRASASKSNARKRRRNR